jgi:hypothetical protein
MVFLVVVNGPRHTVPGPATADIEVSAIATIAVEVNNLNRAWPEATFTPIFAFDFIA